MSLEGVIAVNRFGLGARPGEVLRASADPKSWLPNRCRPATSPEANGMLFKWRGARRRSCRFPPAAPPGAPGQGPEAIKDFARQQRQMLMDEMTARFDTGFTTARPFAERLVWFWNNHFTISTRMPDRQPGGAYEREAIRPFIAGKFEDMLLAVATHPAMLIYLNNAQSIGPDSHAGTGTERGLNENFGRELMELYSLGVDGGYTQADVIAFARLLTGWSIDTGAPEARPPVARFYAGALYPARQLDGVSSGFRYFANRHEPGPSPCAARAILMATRAAGRRSMILLMIRRRRGLSPRKFAVHFIADTPPPESVARLEKIFRDTGGDLKAMAAAVVEDPAAWTPGPGKMRAPVDYITATYRLLDLPQAQNVPRQTQMAMQACRLMGQFPMAAPSPKGWSDQSQDWSGPDAVLSASLSPGNWRRACRRISRWRR